MKPIQKVKEHIKRNPYGKKFLEQYGFKTMTLGLCSAVVNLGFAVFNIIGAFLYDSVWYVAIAGYYIAIIIFRLSVIFADVKARKKYSESDKRYVLLQNKIELAGGAYLVLVEIAMATVITLTVLFEKPVKSSEIMAITTAAYAFFKITMAIINVTKARKHGDPVVQSLRNLNLADACMTMAALTVTLLNTFGKEGGEHFNLVMNSNVGFIACAAVLGIASVMIIKSAKRIKEIRRDGF